MVVKKGWKRFSSTVVVLLKLPLTLLKQHLYVGYTNSLISML